MCAGVFFWGEFRGSKTMRNAELTFAPNLYSTQWRTPILFLGTPKGRLVDISDDIGSHHVELQDRSMEHLYRKKAVNLRFHRPCTTMGMAWSMTSRHRTSTMAPGGPPPGHPEVR